MPGAIAYVLVLVRGFVAREGQPERARETTPLRPLHEDLGARFTSFSGYQMPLQFEGILAEHEAVRSQAGLFDVSHMSNLTLPPGDAQALADALGADATKLTPGEAKYTLALREDGTILDDLIVFRLPNRFHLVPNAGMNEAIANHLAEHGCEVEDRTRGLCILAVQGPKAPGLIEDVLGIEPPTRFTVESLFDEAGFVSGTGYTGEEGAEFVLPIEHAEETFQALIDAGVTPCGLGARDTLRLEKGYCLAGNEFDPPVTPVEANLVWALDLDHDFTGREEVVTRREAGPQRILTGIKLTEKGIPRREVTVHRGDEPVGTVSSGTLSPTLETGIALAYVDPGVAEPGTDVNLDIRGDPRAGTITEVPFV